MSPNVDIYNVDLPNNDIVQTSNSIGFANIVKTFLRQISLRFSAFHGKFRKFHFFAWIIVNYNQVQSSNSPVLAAFAESNPPPKSWCSFANSQKAQTALLGNFCRQIFETTLASDSWL